MSDAIIGVVAGVVTILGAEYLRYYFSTRTQRLSYKIEQVMKMKDIVLKEKRDTFIDRYIKSPDSVPRKKLSDMSFDLTRLYAQLYTFNETKDVAKDVKKLKGNLLEFSLLLDDPKKNMDKIANLFKKIENDIDRLLEKSV